MNQFQFDIRNLPVEGKTVSGTLPPAFFQLAESDSVKPISPMTYHLNMIRDGKDVVVSGQLSATFSLQCGRCLESFPQQVEMEHYHAEVPVEKETTMDLTDMVREDILLALPNFPRCEDGNVDQRACPAEGRFDPAGPAEDEKSPGTDSEVWNVLDKLK